MSKKWFNLLSTTAITSLYTQYNRKSIVPAWNLFWLTETSQLKQLRFTWMTSLFPREKKYTRAINNLGLHSKDIATSKHFSSQEKVDFKKVFELGHPLSKDQPKVINHLSKDLYHQLALPNKKCCSKFRVLTTLPLKLFLKCVEDLSMANSLTNLLAQLNSEL